MPRLRLYLFLLGLLFYVGQFRVSGMETSASLSVYEELQVDRDGDGFLDVEEWAAGSLPDDASSLPANGIVVGSKAELLAAAATATAGDIIVIEDGEYTNLQLAWNAQGTSEDPIVLRARNVGKAEFTGVCQIRLNGNYCVLDGLSFLNGEPSSAVGAIDVRGSYCRVTNCSIVHFNGDSGYLNTDWIGIHGSHNRVDHCHFEGKNGVGPLLVVWRANDSPNYHQIDHNVFKEYTNGGGNGFETVRIGTSTHSLSSSYTTVEYNYFESCDGEAEIISNKSCHNTYRGNTFYECYGALTLRHGNTCVVEDNVFLTNGKSGAFGIRVIDRDHIVRNNYIEGQRGSSSFRGGIVLSTHVTDPLLVEYWEVRNLEVSNNSLINCQQSFIYGVGNNGNPPHSANFINNIARSGLDGEGLFPVIKVVEDLVEQSYTGNLYYGSSVGLSPVPSGINYQTAPNLVQNAQGLWMDPSGRGTQGIIRLYEEDCGPVQRVGALDRVEAWNPLPRGRVWQTDFDGDGFTVLYEFAIGDSLFTGTTAPQPAIIRSESNGFAFLFNRRRTGIAHVDYSVEMTDSLELPNWQVIAVDESLTQPSPQSDLYDLVYAPVPGSVGRRFFRLRINDSVSGM